MLGTGCRPSTAFEYVMEQTDFDADLMDLNPPGRVQTAKYRPIVKQPPSLKVPASVPRAPRSSHQEGRPTYTKVGDSLAQRSKKCRDWFHVQPLLNPPHGCPLASSVRRPEVGDRKPARPLGSFDDGYLRSTCAGLSGPGVRRHRTAHAGSQKVRIACCCLT